MKIHDNISNKNKIAETKCLIYPSSIFKVFEVNPKQINNTETVVFSRIDKEVIDSTQYSSWSKYSEFHEKLFVQIQRENPIILDTNVPTGIEQIVVSSESNQILKDNFITMLKEDNFEFGYSSKSEKFIEDRIKEQSTDTKSWLQQIFIENFGDVIVSTGILHIISHLDYDIVAPEGPIMAVAALSHKDVQVRECGIRAFENWGDKESLEVLKNLRCEEKWLQKYVDQIIKDLEGEFGQNAVTC